MLFILPLAQPRQLTAAGDAPTADPTPPDAPLTLPEVQALADAYTGGTVRLHDPVC